MFVFLSMCLQNLHLGSVDCERLFYWGWACGSDPPNPKPCTHPIQHHQPLQAHSLILISVDAAIETPFDYYLILHTAVRPRPWI